MFQGDKKKGGPKTPTMLDGIPADEMTQEQLVDHLGRIKEELDREREERNFFQLERDKIHTFWEITRRQLEERKAELRNKVKFIYGGSWRRETVSNSGSGSRNGRGRGASPG